MDMKDFERLKKKMDDLALEKARLEGKKEEIMKRLSQKGINSVEELKTKIEEMNSEIELLKNRKEKIENEINTFLEEKGIVL